MSQKPNFPRMLKAELAEVASEMWDKNVKLEEQLETLKEERVQVLNELADLQDAQPDPGKMSLVETVNLDDVLILVNHLDVEITRRKAQRGLMQAAAAERELETLVANAKACLEVIIQAADPE